MADYRQTEGTATSWRRAVQVAINNRLGATPSIAFQEEDVVTVGAQTFNTPVLASSLIVPFDPTASIALIDPTTGAALGSSVSHQELYAILYSIYIKAAQDRDAAAAAPPTPTAPAP